MTPAVEHATAPGRAKSAPPNAYGAARGAFAEAAIHADLLAGVAERRDGKAFEALYRHFPGRIAAHLRRLRVPDGLVQDLTQETMIAVWRRADSYDLARGSVSGWILSIARNLAFDGFRKALGDRRLLTIAEREPLGHAGETPYEALETHEWERLVRAAVTELTSDQFDVIWLAYYQQLTHSEISRRLGLPLGTVKTRLRIATLRMRGVLDRTVVRGQDDPVAGRVAGRQDFRPTRRS